MQRDALLPVCTLFYQSAQQHTGKEAVLTDKYLPTYDWSRGSAGGYSVLYVLVVFAPRFELFCRANRIRSWNGFLVEFPVSFAAASGKRGLRNQYPRAHAARAHAASENFDRIRSALFTGFFSRIAFGGLCTQAEHEAPWRLGKSVSFRSIGVMYSVFS